MKVLEAKNEIRGLNEDAMKTARERQDSLLKPAKSLGVLEDLSVQIAGITGKTYNSLNNKVHFLFGSDNGVYDEGVAAAPQEFTRILMTNYAEGGCGINVICEQHNVELKLIDIGIIGPLDNPKILDKKLMNGTNNIAEEPAMTEEIALSAIQIGFDCALEAKQQGYNIIGTGEVGMANTTTAAACIMATLACDNPNLAVGRGAGLTDEAFEKKKMIIQKSLRLHSPKQDDPISILSKVGGLDIAALTGLYIGAAYTRTPIVIDGVISIAAALLATSFEPLVRDFMIASHISEEPAYSLAAKKMELSPILNLNMRLGEGTGCPLAMNVIDTALAVLRNMNTFDNLKLPTEYQKDIKA